jgi:hypothetical protein
VEKDSDLDRLAVDGMARSSSAITVLEASVFDDAWADIGVRLELLHLLARVRHDVELVMAS